MKLSTLNAKMVLLTVGANSKISKGDGEYLTCNLSLMPNDILCPNRHIKGCAKPCLVENGNNRFPSARAAKIKKTEWLESDSESFYKQLMTDLALFEAYCLEHGYKPCCRLNTYSDWVWEKKAPQIFSSFPNIMFHDYTAIAKRMRSIYLPANYHLTLSYSEATEKYKKQVKPMIGKCNVAVVFRDKLPETFEGVRVINGDETDLRFLDDKNVVVGLLAKGKAKKDESGFVI